MYVIKIVIAAAGNLKREQKDFEEKEIFLQALENVNFPKFLKEDLKLFNGMLIFISRIFNYTQLIFVIKIYIFKLYIVLFYNTNII